MEGPAEPPRGFPTERRISDGTCGAPTRPFGPRQRAAAPGYRAGSAKKRPYAGRFVTAPPDLSAPRSPPAPRAPPPPPLPARRLRDRGRRGRSRPARPPHPGPFEHRLDPAVGAVAHPAGHASPGGLAADRVAEEHALHASRARDAHPSSRPHPVRDHPTRPAGRRPPARARDPPPACPPPERGSIPPVDELNTITDGTSSAIWAAS